jgi:hypothetical protein
VHQQLPADHAITAADAGQPGDPGRASLHRPTAHDGLPKALTRAVRKKRLARAACGEHKTAVPAPWLNTQGTGALIQP